MHRITHRLHVFLHIRNRIFSIRSAELHDRGTNDSTVGKSCHLLCLLRCGDSEADRTRDIFRLFHELHHRADIRCDLASRSSNAKRGYAVYKAGCLFRDHADALVGGRCDEGDQIHIVLFAYRIKLFFLLIRHIRQDQSVHAKLRCLLDETLGSVGEDNIRICHENHRNLCVFPNFFNHCENFVGGHAAGQGADICRLDHRSLCRRIGERDPKLNEVCACLLHCVYKLLRDL